MANAYPERMALKADVAIVGGDILGLAHAYVPARSGKKVAMRDMALRSRGIWLEALRSAKLNFRPTGSLHFAHKVDEADVLREFAELGPPRWRPG